MRLPSCYAVGIANAPATCVSYAGRSLSTNVRGESSGTADDLVFRVMDVRVGDQEVVSYIEAAVYTSEMVLSHAPLHTPILIDNHEPTNCTPAAPLSAL